MPPSPSGTPRGRGLRVGAGRIACHGLLSPAGFVSGVAGSAPVPADGALPSIAVFDFDLPDGQRDDPRDTVPDTTLGPRLAGLRAQRAEALARERVHVVVDDAPARERVDAARTLRDLPARTGSELALGRALDAHRVPGGRVKQVGKPIRIIHVRIEDMATGRLVLAKSVDLCGNTDETWRRGIAFLVRDRVERGRGAR